MFQKEIKNGLMACNSSVHDREYLHGDLDKFKGVFRSKKALYTRRVGFISGINPYHLLRYIFRLPSSDPIMGVFGVKTVSPFTSGSLIFNLYENLLIGIHEAIEKGFGLFESLSFQIIINFNNSSSKDQLIENTADKVFNLEI